MFLKNGRFPAHIFNYSVAPLFLLLLVFLPSWSRTLEVEDPKYIFAFLCFPLLFFLFAKNDSTILPETGQERKNDFSRYTDMVKK
jgi:hypothetical protein